MTDPCPLDREYRASRLETYRRRAEAGEPIFQGQGMPTRDECWGDDAQPGESSPSENPTNEGKQTMSILDAIKTLAENPTDTLDQINTEIETKSQELKMLKSLQRTLAQKNPAVSSRPANEEDVAEIIKVIEANGPMKPGGIASVTNGLVAIQIGKITKNSPMLRRLPDGRIDLVK